MIMLEEFMYAKKMILRLIIQSIIIFSKEIES